jgi:excisionase family DNA binding protein
MTVKSASSDVPAWVEEAVAGLPVLVTTAEATKVLRTTQRNLYRWIAIGKITAVKDTCGGSTRVLIPKSALVKYLSGLQEVA